MVKSTIDWTGKIVAVLASGPSLVQEDIELVKKSGIKTIAVNTTWEKVRFCDVIYAGDNVWWKHHHNSIDIDAERWCCAKAAVIPYKCFYRDRKVKPGYNSGANAIELAANVFKAKTILLLGFDCSVKNGIHHHGNHKNTPNPNERRCEQWKKQFKSLLDLCKNTEIINCSRYTEIKHFPIKKLDAALCELGLI